MEHSQPSSAANVSKSPEFLVPLNDDAAGDVDDIDLPEQRISVDDLQRLNGVKPRREQIPELERLDGHVSQAASRRGSVASPGRQSSRGGSPDDSENGTSTADNGKSPVYKLLRDPEKWKKERTALFDGEQTSLSRHEVCNLFNAAAASHFGKDLLLHEEELAAYNRDLAFREQSCRSSDRFAQTWGFSRSPLLMAWLPPASKQNHSKTCVSGCKCEEKAVMPLSPWDPIPQQRQWCPMGSQQSPESRVSSKPKKARHSMPPPPRSGPRRPLPDRPNSAAGSSTRPGTPLYNHPPC